MTNTLQWLAEKQNAPCPKNLVMPDNQMQLLINWLDYSNDSCQIGQFSQLFFLYLFLTFLFFCANRGQRIMCSSFPPPCGSPTEPCHRPLFVLFFLLSPTPQCPPSKFYFQNGRPKFPIKHSKENNNMRIGCFEREPGNCIKMNCIQKLSLILVMAYKFQIPRVLEGVLQMSFLLKPSSQLILRVLTSYESLH